MNIKALALIMLIIHTIMVIPQIFLILYIPPLISSILLLYDTFVYLFLLTVYAFSEEHYDNR